MNLFCCIQWASQFEQYWLVVVSEYYLVDDFDPSYHFSHFHFLTFRLQLPPNPRKCNLVGECSLKCLSDCGPGVQQVAKLEVQHETDKQHPNLNVHPQLDTGFITSSPPIWFNEQYMNIYLIEHCSASSSRVQSLRHRSGSPIEPLGPTQTRNQTGMKCKIVVSCYPTYAPWLNN